MRLLAVSLLIVFSACMQPEVNGAKSHEHFRGTDASMWIPLSLAGTGQCYDVVSRDSAGGRVVSWRCDGSSGAAYSISNSGHDITLVLRDPSSSAPIKSGDPSCAVFYKGSVSENKD